MATPRLVSVRDFNTSRYAQLADTSTANISDILARAERAIESKIKRPLAPTSYVETHRPQGYTIYLQYRPVISVESISRVSTFGGMMMPAQAYSIDPKQGTISFMRSPVGYAITVEYTAGFEEIPEDIKEAILLQATLMAFADLEVYGSGDGKPPGILYMRDDIDALLRPYKLLHTAF